MKASAKAMRYSALALCIACSACSSALRISSQEYSPDGYVYHVVQVRSTQNAMNGQELVAVQLRRCRKIDQSPVLFDPDSCETVSDYANGGSTLAAHIWSGVAGSALQAGAIVGAAKLLRPDQTTLQSDAHSGDVTNTNTSTSTSTGGDATGGDAIVSSENNAAAQAAAISQSRANGAPPAKPRRPRRLAAPQTATIKQSVQQ